MASGTRSLYDDVMDKVGSIANSTVGSIAGMLGGGKSDGNQAIGPGNIGPGTSSGDNNDDDNSDRRGGYGGYGGYGGRGGGSSGPTANQKKAGNLLGSITGYNADTIKNNFDNMMDAFDIADEQNENLKNANIMLAKQKANADWFPQLYKLQVVNQELKKRAGSGARGSLLYDMADRIAGAFDMINGETLQTMRDNTNNALLSYFETKAQNINSRNEAAADVENALRELAADYQAQLVNIHPDLATGMDTGNHTLTPPDWLKTDFYEANKVSAATPETQGLYRPDKAVSTAWDSGVAKSDKPTASSAASSYWDRMDRGYDQRKRQA